MTDLDKADIARVLRSNLIRLEAALATCRPQEMVFAWPDYWIGIKIGSDGPQAVSIDRATIVRLNDKRTFHNGAKVQAAILPRMVALEGAIELQRSTLSRFA